MPRIGIHTQKIPPITSVKDKRVSSAAGITFDPIEYNIKPKQTIVPCTANKPSFLLEEKKLKSFIKTIAALFGRKPLANSNATLTFRRGQLPVTYSRFM